MFIFVGKGLAPFLKSVMLYKQEEGDKFVKGLAVRSKQIRFIAYRETKKEGSRGEGVTGSLYRTSRN